MYGNQIPSFLKIDYRIRPNKSTERRMFSEAFRRLSLFEPIENYRYVGFGSTTFTDFILFHKALNIQDMISIEKREEYQERFKFNKPFDCVTIKYGESNTVLPQLSWDKRTIVWLDYDGPLTESVLQDVAFVSAKARSGSMLIVTVNANGLRSKRKLSNRDSEKELRTRFQQSLGLEVLPGDIRGKHLQGDELAYTFRRFIIAHVKEALRNRNGITPTESKMAYHSIFNLVYQDNARMLTVGVLFVEAKEQRVFEKCRFERLEYVTPESDKLYEIRVPIMTPHERRYLDQRLPEGNRKEAIEKVGLAEDEIENYFRLYRYCPSFAEIELL